MNRIIKHLFIINPKSFWNKAKQNYVVATIHKFFKEMDDSNYDIHMSRFPRDAAGYIPLFAQALPPETTLRVYAVGGDGVLFDCLNGIMGLENVELAHLPYGQTCNFLRGFDTNPKSLFRAMPRQYEASTMPVDVIRCGDNYGLNHCAIGLEATAIRCAEEVWKSLEQGSSLSRWVCWHWYAPLFFAGGITAAYTKRVRSQQYAIDIDEEHTTGMYKGFSVFNGPYYGGSLCPVRSALPNDGLLDVLSVHIQGMPQTMCLYPLLLAGRYQRFPKYFSVKQGRKIKISADNVFPISLDGVIFFEPEIEIEVLPAAVQFVDASRYGYKGGR